MCPKAAFFIMLKSRVALWVNCPLWVKPLTFAITNSYSATLLEFLIFPDFKISESWVWYGLFMESVVNLAKWELLLLQCLNDPTCWASLIQSSLVRNWWPLVVGCWFCYLPPPTWSDHFNITPAVWRTVKGSNVAGVKGLFMLPSISEGHDFIP